MFLKPEDNKKSEDIHVSSERDGLLIPQNLTASGDVINSCVAETVDIIETIVWRKKTVKILYNFSVSGRPHCVRDV
jgi:hypothetical protein